MSKFLKWIKKVGILAGWLLFLTALSYYFLLVPATYRNTFNNWQVTASAALVSDWLDFTNYAVLIFGIKLAASLIFVFTAITILVTVYRHQKSEGSTPFITSLFLVSLPFILFLNPDQINLALGGRSESTLEALLTSLYQLMGLVGLLLLLCFYFLFPGGATNKFLRWITGIIITVMVIVTAALISEALEQAWLVVMLILLLATVGGSIYQILKLIRLKDRSTLRQTIWVVTALVLLPVALVISGLGQSEASILMSLILPIIVPALLPITLLISVVYTGLWNPRLPVHKGWLVGTVAALAAIALGGTFLVDRLINPPPPPLAELPAEPPFAESTNPLSIIIDTDMAPDDRMAILYLLQKPEAEVLAITVTGTGEAHCKPGVRNALRLVALAGESGIPVACGRETPLQGRNSFPTSWRNTADQMLGLDLPEADNPAGEVDAVTLLNETLNDHPRPVSILTLGPLTNLAEAVQKEGFPKEQLAQVVSMGGAVEVMGNIAASGQGSNYQAEWNFFIDPQSVQIVFEAGLPLTLVPLDATNQVVLDSQFLRWLAANRSTPAAQFIYDFISQNVGRVMAGNYYFWDPLAAAILIDPTLAEYETRLLTVVTESQPNQGDLIPTDDGESVQYARLADNQRFYREFLTGLNQP